jgi:hypothetical protein
LIRWRSWSVRIFCGSCTAVFQHESKNLDQIDSHLEIYNDTYYIYMVDTFNKSIPEMANDFKQKWGHASQMWIFCLSSTRL